MVLLFIPFTESYTQTCDTTCSGWEQGVPGGRQQDPQVCPHWQYYGSRYECTDLFSTLHLKPSPPKAQVVTCSSVKSRGLNNHFLDKLSAPFSPRLLSTSTSPSGGLQFPSDGSNHSQTQEQGVKTYSLVANSGAAAKHNLINTLHSLSSF